MADNKELATVEQAIKKTGRGGKYNFPSSVPPESPEVVKAALSPVLYWFQLGLEDKPQSDDEVEKRVVFFFRRCAELGERPTVEKLALALGVSRKVLFDWESGRTQSPRRGDIIKSAKENLAAFDADLAAAGKMNPVPYIFRAKNYYGMRDQVDIVAAPGAQLSDKSADEIAATYTELPDD